MQVEQPATRREGTWTGSIFYTSGETLILLQMPLSIGEERPAVLEPDSTVTLLAADGTNHSTGYQPVRHIPLVEMPNIEDQPHINLPTLPNPTGGEEKPSMGLGPVLLVGGGLFALNSLLIMPWVVKAFKPDWSYRRRVAAGVGVSMGIGAVTGVARALSSRKEE